MTKLIQPAEVKRDEMGHWWHPDLPTFAGEDEADETSPKRDDWRREQGLEIIWCDLEGEPEEHPVYQSYFERADPDPNITGWEPAPPENEGWFMLAICDTEDGPRVWFARRIDTSASVAEETAG